MFNKKTKNFVLILAFFSFYIIYLYWRAAYTIPIGLGWLSLIFGMLLYSAEVVGFFESALFYLTLWDTNTPKTPKVDEEGYPDVDIFVATYNEPSELLYKTIIGCKNMDYPQKERVHIHICDDGNRSEILDLCKKLDVGYITRTENTHAKAGNLNNALSKTNSPYVVTFDADMIPMSDFLIKTMPFFIKDKNTGFVQVPQNFYNPDTFQYNLFSENNIPNEQELFSRQIQAGKSRFNATIYAGSNTVISRKALDEIGGLVVGTITEDFATGMKIQSKGYKTVYLNEVHASGLSPDNLEDLYNQRIRWGRGVIQTFKSFSPIFQKGLNFKQKLMYFSAFFYWYFGIWRFIFFVSPILYSVFGIVVLQASAISILEVWLPMFILTNITFKVFSKGVRTTKWSHIYDTIMFPQVTIGVLMESFGFKLSKFKVTPKENITRRNFVNKFRLVWTQIILASLSLIAIIRLGYLSIVFGINISYVINIFWLSYNFYLLFMAILFASERPKFRSSERQVISTPASIKFDDKIINGTTYDISENGVSILVDKPFYIEPDKTHKISISTQRYFTKVFGEIVHVANFNERYKYVFQFNADERNYQQLLGILYDRVPYMPGKISKDIAIKNIINNLKKRRKAFTGFNRKLPRIPVFKDLIAFDGQEEVLIHMEDFNYLCCRVRGNKKHTNLIVHLINNVKLELKLSQELSDKKGQNLYLYEVVNYKQIIRSVNGLVFDDYIRVSEDVFKEPATAAV